MPILRPCISTRCGRIMRRMSFQRIRAADRDWAAFCSNWLVQWERFEDLACRDKMLRGLEDLKRMPDRLLTGPVFGYDPKTGY